MSRVLLVDDDADALSIRQLIFENRGHRVIAAFTATEAREQFHSQRPDTVILDLRLPDVQDGLALLREFRTASPKLKIVVLSGCTTELDGESILADVVLQKPVRTEVLLRAIRV